MTESNFERYIDELRRLWPEYVLAVQPYTRAEDPEITHFVHVLNVPSAQLRAVSRRGWELAFEYFPADAVPFHLTPITPTVASEYFAEELARSAQKQIEDQFFVELLKSSGARRVGRSKPLHLQYGISLLAGAWTNPVGHYDLPTQVRPLKDLLDSTNTQTNGVHTPLIALPIAPPPDVSYDMPDIVGVHSANNYPLAA